MVTCGICISDEPVIFNCAVVLVIWISTYVYIYIYVDGCIILCVFHRHTYKIRQYQVY